jgi:hypothetical protein
MVLVWLLQLLAVSTGYVPVQVLRWLPLVTLVLVLVLYQSAIHQLSANKLRLVKKTRFGGFFFVDELYKQLIIDSQRYFYEAGKAHAAVFLEKESGGGSVCPGIGR